tara:strand:- start:711 stop:875 length:165 start_codon:yes stop_codon:yes gene_type:complete
MSSEKLKKYRVIKEFFVEANNESEAERKANYKEIDSFIQSTLIDVQELEKERSY